MEKQREHHIKLLSDAITFMLFKKVCIGSSQENMENKLDDLIKRILSSLPAYDILPKELLIKQDNFRYLVGTDSFAMVLDCNVHYYHPTFHSSNNEEHYPTTTKGILKDERDALKNHRLAKGLYHHGLIKSIEKKQINVEGSTEQEVFEKFKKSYWKLIKSFKVEEQPGLHVTLEEVYFTKNNSEPYKGHGVISIEKAIALQQNADTHNIENGEER